MRHQKHSAVKDKVETVKILDEEDQKDSQIVGRLRSGEDIHPDMRPNVKYKSRPIFKKYFRDITSSESRYLKWAYPDASSAKLSKVVVCRLVVVLTRRKGLLTCGYCNKEG